MTCIIRFIKHIQEIIAEPLTIIINKMLNTGIFPDSLKISKVSPLLKKDNDKLLFKLLTYIPTAFNIKNI